jgi:predicted MFS family arabinose efflux permease
MDKGVEPIRPFSKRQRRAGMLRLLRQRDFGLMWSGQLLSNLGNWLLILAIPVYVFELTGSVASTSAAVLAETLPALLLGPLAGVAADRWNRRTIMLLCDALRAPIVLGMLLVNDAGDLWLLYAIVFAESCVSQMFNPAHRALLPGLVGRGPELAAANGMYSLANGVVRLAGGPLGGALYLAIGFDALVIVDAATYAVSGLLLIGVRYTTPSGQSKNDDAGETRGRLTRQLSLVWLELVEGVRALRDNVLLSHLLGSSAIFLLGNSALTVMLVPYVYQRLHGDAGSIGALFAALGVGYLLSAPLARRMADVRAPRWTLAGLLTGVTVSFVGLFNWPEQIAALVFICAVGVAGGAVLAVVQTLIQRHTVDSVLGRVAAAYSSVEILATVVGAAAGGAVASAIGLVPAANIAIALVGTSIGLALMVPSPPEASEAPAHLEDSTQPARPIKPSGFGDADKPDDVGRPRSS